MAYDYTTRRFRPGRPSLAAAQINHALDGRASAEALAEEARLRVQGDAEARSVVLGSVAAETATAVAPKLDRVGGDASQTTALAQDGDTARSMAERFASYRCSILDHAADPQSADNYSAIMRAIDRTYSRGGGIVEFPAGKRSWRTATGLVVPSGVALVGSGARVFYGSNTSPETWTDIGPWLRCTDPTNPAIRIEGVGCAVRGLNIINSQPVPPSSGTTGWTPTEWPWAIEVVQNKFTLSDLMIMGSTHGININYGSASGGGTYSKLEHLYLSTFKRGIRFRCVNDTLYANDIHHRSMWLPQNQAIAAYMLANLIGWDVQYLDNIMASHVEFLQAGIGMLFTDASVLFGGSLGTITHALGYASLFGFDFNLCRQAMKVAGPNTGVQAAFVAPKFQSDLTTGQADDWFCDLGSDRATVQMVSPRASFIGRGFARIGGGIGGRLSLVDPRIDGYSGNGAGNPCFLVRPGAVLDLPTGTQAIRGATPAGGGAPGPNIALEPGGRVAPLRIADAVQADAGGGTVALVPSLPGDAFTGSVEFFGPDGARHNYIGRGSASGELNVVSEGGPVNVFTPSGQFRVGDNGSVVMTDTTGVRTLRMEHATGNVVLKGTLTQNGTP